MARQQFTVSVSDKDNVPEQATIQNMCIRYDDIPEMTWQKIRHSRTVSQHFRHFDHRQASRSISRFPLPVRSYSNKSHSNG